MNRKDVLAAVRAMQPAENFILDGLNEDERPANDEDLAPGAAAYRKRVRTAGSVNKEQVAIRFGHEVLAAFRAAGPGWQTRMNDALKGWLRRHSAV